MAKMGIAELIGKPGVTRVTISSILFSSARVFSISRYAIFHGRVGYPPSLIYGNATGGFLLLEFGDDVLCEEPESSFAWQVLEP